MTSFGFRKTSHYGKRKETMRFLEVYQGYVYGVIEGLDRIRFRGTDRMLSNTSGFSIALHRMGVLLKNFGCWAETRTKLLRDSCEQQAHKLGIPMHYLRRSGEDKEARRVGGADAEPTNPRGVIMPPWWVPHALHPPYNYYRCTSLLFPPCTFQPPWWVPHALHPPYNYACSGSFPN